jgi:hypothetical protein
VRVLVAPEEALNAGARRRDGRRERTRLFRDQRHCLQRRRMTVGETAHRRQCPGTGEQKLGSVPHGRRLWEQAERSAEPSRGTLRCEPCCYLARFT